MLSMRILGLLALLVATPLFAHPAPERSVAPPDVAPTAYSQTDPDIASNGRGFVAAWSDTRMSEHPNFSDRGAVFATRVDEDGRSLDPFGIELARGAFEPRIASNGNGYMVGYIATGGGVRVLHLGDDARPDSAPRVLSSNGGLLDLDSNGASYCALTGGVGSTTATIFDSQGTILRTIAIEGWATSVVSTSDGSYMVLSIRRDCSTTPCNASIDSTSIAADGSLNKRTIATRDPEPVIVRALSNGSRILVSWLAKDAQMNAIEFTMLRADGSSVGAVHRVDQTAASPNDDWSPIPSLAFDGRSFLVLWPAATDAAEAATRAVRIDENGDALDVEPLDLAAGALAFRAARHASKTVLVSSETFATQPDVVARAISSFDLLPSWPPASVIAFSPTTQCEPDSATSGRVVMTVAREGDSYGAIGATVFVPGVENSGTHIALAGEVPNLLQDGPSAGVAGDVFLAAWRERGDRSTRILARRIAANGTVLDSAPIVIADEAVSFAAFGDTAIASDGETFLVVWHGADDEIRALRVRRDGTTIRPAITISRHPADQKRERRTPAALWTGTTYLIVWNELLVPDGNVSAANPTHVSYRAARVARDGTLLDAGESASLHTLAGGAQGLALARSADRVLLTTATGSYIGTPWSIDVLMFDIDGNPLSSTPLRLAEAAYPSRLMNPAAAWDGQSFLLFWNDRATDSSIRGAKLNREGNLIAHFDASNETSYSPTAVSIDGGAVLVHTAIAPDQANVARLFTRTFAPDPGPQRRRSARH